MKRKTLLSLEEFDELYHKPVTSSEMKTLEEKAENLGISKIVMMENAGKSISDYAVANYFHGKSSIEILIVAGAGNNGGDAFAAARHLSYYRPKVKVKVLLIGNESNLKAAEARLNWSILSKIQGIESRLISSVDDLNILREYLGKANVLIVGIFGTGFKGKPRDIQMEIIEILNTKKRDADLISVDLPSGMEADTGTCEFAIKSEVTITMHAPKIGMLSNPFAREKCGKILVANIGIPF